MHLTRLCSLDEVPESTLRRFIVDGREILVARVEGEFYALTERCTHRGGPLSEGTLEEGLITCPWHFGQFDLKTGRAAGPPASEPLEKYEVRIEGEGLFLATPQVMVLGLSFPTRGRGCNTSGEHRSSAW